MRHLILHIGTEKTGSSSIQRFLSRNARPLAAHGWRTPTSLADAAGNHSCLPLLAYDSSREDDLSRRWLDPGRDREEQIEARRRSFCREIEAGGGSSWILSSEHLQSRLTSEAELLRLRRLLEELFDPITLVLYLRRPIATAVSLWSTAVQCGHPYAELPSPSHPYWRTVCDHRATIRRWRACFGDSELRLRLFERGELIGADVVADFCATAGIQPERHWAPPRLENGTLSHRGILLCAHLNRRLPRIDSGRARRLVGLIARTTAGLPAYTPTAREEQAYEDAFGPSCDWVRTHHFPERSQLWRPSGSDAAVPARPPLRLSRLERSSIDALAALWIWLERSRPQP